MTIEKHIEDPTEHPVVRRIANYICEYCVFEMQTVTNRDNKAPVAWTVKYSFVTNQLVIILFIFPICLLSLFILLYFYTDTAGGKLNEPTCS